MTDEQKRAYTERIKCANKTQLVTILHEMTADYLNDARDDIAAGNFTEAGGQIDRAIGCVDQLIRGLDMSVEISGNLLQLYLFAKQEITRALTDHDPKHFDDANIVIDGLHNTYLELEKLDTSGPAA